MSESPAVESKESETEPHVRMCLLGSTAAGKTCFLAGLAILAEANRETPLQILATGDEKRKIQDLSASLRRQAWPIPTNTTEVLQLRVIFDRCIFDFVVVDYPGGDFLGALTLLEQDQIAELYEHYVNSDVLLLIVDPRVDIENYGSDDPEIREQTIKRQDALLTSIQNAYHKLNGAQAAPGTLRNRDVALVLTKVDEFPSLNSPNACREFCEKHASPLLAKLREHASDLAYFPLSAVGAVESLPNEDGGTRTRPAKVLAPHGYEEVFRWIADQRQRRRTTRVIKRVLAVVAPVAAALGLFVLWDYSVKQRGESILADPGKTTVERLSDTAKIYPWCFPDFRRQRTAVFDERLDELTHAVKVAKTEVALIDSERELRSLQDLQPGILLSKIERLQSQVTDQRQLMRFDRIRILYDQSDLAFPDEARVFLKDFSAGQYAESVKEKLSLWQDRERKAARAVVRDRPVIDADTLRLKGAEIRNYLSKHEDKETDAVRIRRAGDLASQFSQLINYRVGLKSSGSFDKERGHIVKIYRNGGVVAEFLSPDVATRKNWDNCHFNVDFIVGDKIRVELYETDYFDDLVAASEKSSGISLDLLDFRSDPKRYLTVETDWNNTLSDISVQFEIEQLSADDWSIVRDYLVPGERW